MGAPYLRTSAEATEATVEAAMARRVVDFIFVDRVRWGGGWCCCLLLLEGDKMWNQMKRKEKKKKQKGVDRDWYLKQGKWWLLVGLTGCCN